MDNDNRLRRGTYSFYESTVAHLEQLSAQRLRERDTDLLRQALHVGSLFVSLLGEADPASGNFGLYSTDELAVLLRPWVVIALDWLEQHGHPIANEAAAAVNIKALFSLLCSLGTSDFQQDQTAQRTAVVEGTGPLTSPGAGAVISGDVLASLKLDDDPIV